MPPAETHTSGRRPRWGQAVCSRVMLTCVPRRIHGLGAPTAVHHGLQDVICDGGHLGRHVGHHGLRGLDVVGHAQVCAEPVDRFAREWLALT